MKRYLLAIALLIIVNTAFAQVESNVSKSAITFEIKNLGIKTGGKLGGLQANIKFDPANLAASNIDATVDATTINTDNNLRDEHLRGEDYFNTAVFPKIIMSSVGFKQKGSNYVGQFNLTIKGKTKQVDVPFSYTPNGNTSTFKGSFKIKRADFGIGGNSLTMGDEATVLVTAEVTK
ncbi:YceI family protein [Inquilinus sp. KBS0705]|nr:YceI family protein [Inquilinus sp. KBS0705]